MTVHVLTLRNGEKVRLLETDGGEFPCLVCGDLLAIPPLRPNDGIFRDNHATVAHSNETCPCCGTEYGYDIGVHQQMPIGEYNRNIERLRFHWLKDSNWSESSLSQLRNNLGIEIDEEELKRNFA